MNQSSDTLNISSSLERTTSSQGQNLALGGVRIAFIQASWSENIVDQCRLSFIEEMKTRCIQESQIDIFKVAGSLEIPLQAKLLAQTGSYDAIACAGLIVDGGIYRHEFVTSAVIDGMMQVQLETLVPVLSAVLTPHHFQETEVHEKFFFDHFRTKGKELANACFMTVENVASLRDYAQSAQAAHIRIRP
jgi:6,7-dimethyl-8-ribityllumazine synthase